MAPIGCSPSPNPNESSPLPGKPRARKTESHTLSCPPPGQVPTKRKSLVPKVRSHPLRPTCSRAAPSPEPDRPEFPLQTAGSGRDRPSTPLRSSAPASSTRESTVVSRSAPSCRRPYTVSAARIEPDRTSAPVLSPRTGPDRGRARLILPRPVPAPQGVTTAFHFLRAVRDLVTNSGEILPAYGPRPSRFAPVVHLVPRIRSGRRESKRTDRWVPSHFPGIIAKSRSGSGSPKLHRVLREWVGEGRLFPGIVVLGLRKIGRRTAVRRPDSSALRSRSRTGERPLFEWGTDADGFRVRIRGDRCELDLLCPDGLPSGKVVNKLMRLRWERPSSAPRLDPHRSRP
jgi:hypothetical protein